MSDYSVVGVFNDAGLAAFKNVFEGSWDHETVNPMDPALMDPLPGSRSFTAREFDTAKEMAQAILASIGHLDWNENLKNEGLWAWLTFVLRDQLFKRGSDGVWKVGEIHSWYPSNPNDYQKGQRHRVRMPTFLLKRFGDTADHLLSTPPAVMSQIRESLVSQQDMFTHTFQTVSRALYFDESTGKLKRGAGSKSGGSARRLATIRKQLDVTWDLESLSPKQILEMLPREFDRFKPE